MLTPGGLEQDRSDCLPDLILLPGLGFGAGAAGSTEAPLGEERHAASRGRPSQIFQCLLLGIVGRVD
ncbi:MAG: hypothetical protein KA128_15040, partial [Zoogloea sp.]|nr:hypothetical protein [Zoogloea sp.]